MFSFQGASESLKRLNETPTFVDASVNLFKKWWAKMDSLSCGKATAVTICHRHIVKNRLSSHFVLLPNSSVPSDRFFYFASLKWWAKMDSNHRPHDYQSCALASWAIGPYPGLLLVESTGIEPVTSCLQGRRSPSWANPPFLRDPHFLGTLKTVPSKLNNVTSVLS